MRNKKKIKREFLYQRWIHSHEEDSDTEMVYRPSNFAFPPSRGRTGFELKSDGSCIEIGIGPADGFYESQGTWETQEDDHLTVCINPQTNNMRVMHVTSVDKDRLVIMK
ncbi:MAG: hypothetical protein V3T19_11875 [Acidiferrobacterales bacterium]